MKRIVIAFAALGSFAIYVWLEGTLGRSASRGWLFFVAYVLAALLVGRGDISQRAQRVFSNLGLDRLRIVFVLRALMCWIGGLLWVYCTAPVTNDTLLGGLVVFGPLVLLLVVGAIFMIRGFGFGR